MGEEDTKNLLPEIDRDYLDARGYEYEVVPLGGELHLIIYGYELPEAYTPRKADLLIILPPGYPNSNPDMFWTNPSVKLTSGAWPKASEYHHTYGNQSWQRWSRHFPSGAWRPGVDNIRTYLASVRRELDKGI